jgi:hypothetical protein
MTTPASTFTRRMPPLAVRCVMGITMFGVLGPIFRTLQMTGHAPAVFTASAAKRYRLGKARNPLRGYTPTSHDVFVAAHVRSGTNWMMQIAHQLAFHGHGEYEHIHCVVPWPDAALTGPRRDYAIPIDDPSVWSASPEQKRVIKTHFDWDWLPYSEDARYIIVIRDPKDVFVSSYFFFFKNGPLRFMHFSVDTWFEVFLSSGLGIWSSWATNTAGYWAQRHRPNVLIVSFKSLKTDLRGTVRAVADFMGVQAGEAVIDRVCEKSSFEYMKQIDHKFRTWELIPWVSTSATIMRRGGESGPSELLSLEQRRRMDRHWMAELKRLGSDLPYEEFCDLSPGLTVPTL